jgi:hypothetical protein
VPASPQALFPKDENLVEGMHVVNLYQDGEWATVVVDSLTPCDPRGVPISPHCKDCSISWPLILCKAMAKLFGNYEVTDVVNTWRFLY